MTMSVCDAAFPETEQKDERLRDGEQPQVTNETFQDSHGQFPRELVSPV